MDKVILSEKDSRRVEEAIRKIEARARAIMPYYRRRTRGTPGSKGSEIHVAYCKTDAGSGNTITCYLDTDGTGQEITVYCNLYEAGNNLSECAPLLADGDAMLAVKIGADWLSLTTFIPTDTCE